MSRRYFVGIGVLLFTHLTLADYALPNWNYLEFEESTPIGIVRVRIASDTLKSPRTITQLKVKVDGRTLEIPDMVKREVTEPHLDRVSLNSVGAVTCMQTNCPSPADFPIELHLPYGDFRLRDEDDDRCDTSEILIKFSPRHVVSIKKYECSEEDEHGSWKEMFPEQKNTSDN